MKREITYYMRPWYPVTIIEDTEEGGYTVTLPDCPGCVTLLPKLGRHSGDNRRCTKGVAGGGYGKRDTADRRGFGEGSGLLYGPVLQHRRD